MKKQLINIAYLAFGMLFWASSCTQQAQEKAAYALETSEISPKELSKIDNEKETILKLNSGTQLTIPAQTFKRKDGKAIEGEVEVVFKEVHTYSELYAAGVPMFFQEEDGRTGQMVSSAMMNLNAYDASGAELEMKVGKAVKIDMMCQANFEGFDLFYLENQKEKTTDKATFLQIPIGSRTPTDNKVFWSRKESVSIVKNQNLILDSTTEKVSALKQPVAPVKNNDDKLYFNVNIDTKKFPQFKSFQSLIWTFASDTTDEKILQKKWDAMDIDDSGLGYYTMTLKDKKTSQSIAVVPVLEGEEFTQAMKEFEYNKASYEEKLKAEKRVNKSKANAQAFVASFLASRTGWYNVDAVYHQISKLKPYAPEFIVDGKTIEFKKLKMMSYFTGAKSLVTYTPENIEEFFYIELFENALLVEDKNGVFYGISASNFKKNKLSETNKKVNLERVEINTKNISALENQLSDLMDIQM